MGNKVHPVILWIGIAQNIVVMLVKIAPALILWLAMLGAIRVDVRNWNGEDAGYGYPEFQIPGWTKNELSWFVTPRFFASYIL